VDLLLSIGVRAHTTGRQSKKERMHEKYDTHNSDLCKFVPLKTATIDKKHKGARTPNPACNISRRILEVPVYGHSVYKGMWKINPYSVNMPPQTHNL